MHFDVLKFSAFEIICHMYAFVGKQFSLCACMYIEQTGTVGKIIISCSTLWNACVLKWKVNQIFGIQWIQNLCAVCLFAFSILVWDFISLLHRFIYFHFIKIVTMALFLSLCAPCKQFVSKIMLYCEFKQKKQHQLNSVDMQSGSWGVLHSCSFLLLFPAFLTNFCVCVLRSTFDIYFKNVWAFNAPFYSK